jgi:hypothetical protein
MVTTTQTATPSTILNILAHVEVPDLDAGVTLYESLLGRAPDRRPMVCCVVIDKWTAGLPGNLPEYRAARDRLLDKDRETGSWTRRSKCVRVPSRLGGAVSRPPVRATAG